MVRTLRMQVVSLAVNVGGVATGRTVDVALYAENERDAERRLESRLQALLGDMYTTCEVVVDEDL